MKLSAGHGQLLLHPPAPLAHGFLAALPETKMGEQFLDAALPFAAGYVPEAPVELQIIEGRQALV